MRNFLTIQTTQGGNVLLNINYIVQVSPIDENSVSVLTIAGDRIETFTAVGSFESWKNMIEFN